MENETTTPGATSGGDKPGLVDIARGAAATAEAPRRGRGRPPGTVKTPGAASGSAGIPVPPVPQEPVIVWTDRNVGALVRLPFNATALVTGIKELALNEAEQKMLIDPFVEVFREFAPIAAAKYAAIVTASTALLSVSMAKWYIYKETKEAQAKAEAKIRGLEKKTEEPAK